MPATVLPNLIRLSLPSNDLRCVSKDCGLFPLSSFRAWRKAEETGTEARGPGKKTFVIRRTFGNPWGIRSGSFPAIGARACDGRQQGAAVEQGSRPRAKRGRKRG